MLISTYRPKKIISSALFKDAKVRRIIGPTKMGSTVFEITGRDGDALDQKLEEFRNTTDPTLIWWKPRLETYTQRI